MLTTMTKTLSNDELQKITGGTSSIVHVVLPGSDQKPLAKTGGKASETQPNSIIRWP